MISILSPSKNINENPKEIISEFSVPDFLEQSEIIVKKLRKFSPTKLQKLMNINSKLADLNVNRFLKWTTPFNENNAAHALLMFSGEVFNGLAAHSLSKDNLIFSQNHLRILSGLYGILKPMDLMQPYRLEMGTMMSVGRKKNLYDFWGDALTAKLNEELENHSEKVLLNLASDEYFKSINTKKLKAKIIKCQFKEEKEGKLKFITIYGKKARGLMARFIIENGIDKAEDVKAFDVEGYYYNSYYSNDELWMFSR